MAARADAPKPCASTDKDAGVAPEAAVAGKCAVRVACVRLCSISACRLVAAASARATWAAACRPNEWWCARLMREQR